MIEKSSIFVSIGNPALHDPVEVCTQRFKMTPCARDLSGTVVNRCKRFGAGEAQGEIQQCTAENASKCVYISKEVVRSEVYNIHRANGGTWQYHV